MKILVTIVMKNLAKFKCHFAKYLWVSLDWNSLDYSTLIIQAQLIDTHYKPCFRLPKISQQTAYVTHMVTYSSQHIGLAPIS